LKSRFFILICLFLAGAVSSSQAQPSPLPNISVATRSDGLGYVVRLHLASPADSFKLIQPSADLIQVAVYKNGIAINAVRLPQPRAPFAGMKLHSIPRGVGLDIRLAPDQYYIAKAYPDANGRHLLVALTRSNARELGILSQGMSPIDWVAATARPTTSPAQTPVRTEPQPAPTPVVSAPVDTTRRVPIPANSYDRKLHTIVIDAGHGGHDPGAIGPRGTREKDVVLKVALRLGELIKERMPDVNVVYTRSDDRFINLYERGRMANRAKGDLFVSIHANSNRSSQPSGAEVYFLGLHRSDDAFEVMKKENSVIALEDPATRTRELTDEEIILYELTNTAYIANSQYFSALLDEQFKDHAQRRSRGVKQAGFLVLYHASMPAVLIETGFISNPTEEQFLRSDSGQRLLAESIFNGIKNYRTKVER
jgi:N-acetylmuramoyl-L-alanine amidase